MPTNGFQVRALARALTALLALGAAFAAVPARAADTARCPGSTAVPTAGTVDEAGDQVVCLINAERTDRGLRPLRGDGDLARAARRHSADMVRRTYFSHVTPGGSGLGDRIRAVGYGSGHAWRAGEALGWGTGARATPADLVDEWLASPPHRHIILDPGYRELGVGVSAGAPRNRSAALPGATYTVDVGVVH
jgi:uncharacterized protein YkwD